MVLEDAIDDFIELLRIFCPMNLHTVFLGIGGELVEVFVQMRNRMALDGTGFLAQLLPFIKAVGHIVAFRADCPERGVVPVGILLVL